MFKTSYNSQLYFWTWTRTCPPKQRCEICKKTINERYDHFLLGTFFQIPENSEHLVNKLFFSFFSHLVQLILFPKFCTKPPIINHLLITEERAGGKEGTGAEIGEKGILQKWNEPV